MTVPQDRVGVFLVPAQYTAALEKAAQEVESLEFDDDGVSGPEPWYIARHELFERLLAVATAHRLLGRDALDDLVNLVEVLDKGNRMEWKRASPSARRVLAANHIEALSNPVVRAAVAEVLAQDAGPDAGLFIETEAALPKPPAPPEPDADEPHEDISPEEALRLLKAFVQKQERAFPREATRHAFVCELPEDAVKRNTLRLRGAAITCTKATDPYRVDALEELCQRAPVEKVAPCVYSAAQARELLRWLRKQRKSPARDLMISVLRPAVANKHAFAIVFEPVLR